LAAAAADHHELRADELDVDAVLEQMAKLMGYEEGEEGGAAEGEDDRTASGAGGVGGVCGGGVPEIIFLGTGSAVKLD